MRGIILTGPTGVGKTTVALKLQAEHGFWTPTTLTTRSTEPDDQSMRHVVTADFLRLVRASEIVFPAFFGANWYGWQRDDFERLRHGSGNAVLNVRPYAALLLRATLGEFAAVWLTIGAAELTRRRGLRSAERDVDDALRKRRQDQENLDAPYEGCFLHVLTADAGVIPRLLDLVA